MGVCMQASRSAARVCTARCCQSHAPQVTTIIATAVLLDILLAMWSASEGLLLRWPWRDEARHLKTRCFHAASSSKHERTHRCYLRYQGGHREQRAEHPTNDPPDEQTTTCRRSSSMSSHTHTAIAVPLRRVPPLLVDPRVPCFVQCASLCCFSASSQCCCPTRTHRAGQAGRDALSLL